MGQSLTSLKSLEMYGEGEGASLPVHFANRNRSRHPKCNDSIVRSKVRLNVNSSEKYWKLIDSD